MAPPATADGFDPDRYRVVFTDEPFDAIAAEANQRPLRQIEVTR